MDQTSIALTDALRPGAIRSVFQPIVDLDTGQVVAYEALARGPQGPLERPDLLFAAARAAGRLADLDAACRTAAFRGAVDLGLLAPLTVFVNVEPEVLDCAPLDDLLATQQDGQLAITGVLASLYPVSTVILAQLVLRERLVGAQVAGLGAAVAAVVLITAG